jgi:hypothetical protein
VGQSNAKEVNTMRSILSSENDGPLAGITANDEKNVLLINLPRAPHHPRRKIYCSKLPLLSAAVEK